MLGMGSTSALIFLLYHGITIIKCGQIIVCIILAVTDQHSLIVQSTAI